MRDRNQADSTVRSGSVQSARDWKLTKCREELVTECDYSMDVRRNVRRLVESGT